MGDETPTTVPLKMDVFLPDQRRRATALVLARHLWPGAPPVAAIQVAKWVTRGEA